MAIPQTYSYTKTFKVFVMLLFVVLALFLVTSPKGVLADGLNCQQQRSSTFFGLKTWYAYLPTTPQTDSSNNIVKRDNGDYVCNIASSSSNLLGKNSFVVLIVLAVVDDLLRVAGIVAVVFVIVGGFKFITAGGEPEQIASAKKSITYAIIGLVVALIAVVIVSFIGNQLGVK